MISGVSGNQPAPHPIWARAASISSVLTKAAQVAGGCFVGKEALHMVGIGMPMMAIPCAAAMPLVTKPISFLADRSGNRPFRYCAKKIDDHIGHLGQLASLVSAVAMAVMGAPLQGFTGVVLGLNATYLSYKVLRAIFKGRQTRDPARSSSRTTSSSKRSDRREPSINDFFVQVREFYELGEESIRLSKQLHHAEGQDGDRRLLPVIARRTQIERRKVVLRRQTLWAEFVCEILSREESYNHYLKALHEALSEEIGEFEKATEEKKDTSTEGKARKRISLQGFRKKGYQKARRRRNREALEKIKPYVDMLEKLLRYSDERIDGFSQYTFEGYLSAYQSMDDPGRNELRAQYNFSQGKFLELVNSFKSEKKTTIALKAFAEGLRVTLQAVPNFETGQICNLDLAAYLIQPVQRIPRLSMTAAAAAREATGPVRRQIRLWEEIANRCNDSCNERIRQFDDQSASSSSGGE